MRNWKASSDRARFEKYDAEGKITRRGTLRIYCEPYPHRENYHLLIVWGGKRSTPDFDYLVRSDSVNERIAKMVVGDIERLERNEKTKAARKERMDKESSRYEVGAILSGSWGYDQTNVELFEVVERPTPRTVVIRAVDRKTVEGSEGFMSRAVLPVPGAYVDEPFRKRITANGVKHNDHCHLTPTDTTKKHYESWYA